MSSSSSVSKSNKMPAAKKDSKIVAPTPVVAAPAPKVEAKESKAKAEPKAEKATKTKAEKVATPAKAEVTVPTVTSPSAEPVVAAPSVTSETQLAALAETLKALSTDLSTRVRDAVKAVQEAAKAAKREARDSKKKKKVDPATMTTEQRAAWEKRRANNAFLVQRPLTDELCHFMGLKSGETRSQTQVTKFISEYVKTHSCFDPSFKRRILPNAALAKLLRVGDKDEVTYLNLQSFLKVHFIKSAPKA
jgi:chromatin remodeling complex protein RSC6